MNDFKTPAFQFYPADFLVGTASMTATEVGAYIRFLCYQWTHGGITHDLGKAARLAGVSRAIAEAVLKSKFVKGADGSYRNARLEQVRQDQQEFREKQMTNGRKGGRPPKPRDNPGLSSGLSGSEPSGNPDESSSPSSSSSSSPKTERDGSLFSPGFPATEEDALSAIPEGIVYPREFVIATWLKASSRGGRDAKSVAICHWPNYVGSEWIFEQNRIAKEKSHGNHQHPDRPRVDRAQNNLNQGLDAKFAALG